MQMKLWFGLLTLTLVRFPPYIIRMEHRNPSQATFHLQATPGECFSPPFPLRVWELKYGNRNVYSGSNGANWVYSFLPTSGTVTNFSGDLNVFLKVRPMYGGNIEI